jgi:hypothetical protein
VRGTTPLRGSISNGYFSYVKKTGPPSPRGLAGGWVVKLYRWVVWSSDGTTKICRVENGICAMIVDAGKM